MEPYLPILVFVLIAILFLAATLIVARLMRHGGGGITNRDGLFGLFLVGSFLSALLGQPLQLLFGTVQAAGRDHLDSQREFALEVGDLVPATVLQGVGQLRMQLDAHGADEAVGRASLDLAQQPETDQLRARDATDAVAGRAGAIGTHQ